MNIPTRKIVVKVAGVTFENRQSYLSRLVISDPVKIVPEPENPYDANALAVHIAHDGNVWHCGFIPREKAAEIAPLLEGEGIMAKIGEITGGFEQSDGSLASYGLRLIVEIPYEPIVGDIPF